MKTILVTLAIAAGTVAAVAQTAAPAPTPAPAATITNDVAIKYPWESSVSAGLTLIRGNKSSTLLTADFITKKKTKVNEYTLGAAAAYGEQNSQETVNNYKTYGQWNHLFTERFYGYLRTEGLHDSVAFLDYRFNIGTGLGYYFIKSKQTSLSVEAGAGYEAQRLGGDDQSFATVRLAEQFEHKFNEHARLWQSAELLPQVDKWANYLINFEVGLEAPISKSFSLKTYLQDNYANRPAAGRKHNDTKLVAAIAYKF
jgi:putative salt-induced outer membrane protein YdiY